MTIPVTQNSAEQTGAAFELEKLLEVRTRARAAIDDIGRRITPGITEEAARQIATDVLKDMGMRRGWHKVLVRFGVNTLKTFSEPSEPDRVLGDNDIFFIDIGPVWNGHEGDAGDTFVVGGDPAMQACAAAAKQVFSAVRNKWREDGLSGQELYDFAARSAADMGWQLNLKMEGHRVADFPHNVYHSGTLATADFRPSANLWVLEIQIRHPEQDFGAFYEDLLLDEGD